MSHMHITSWVAAIVLLFVAMSMLKKGNQSNYKMMHMILRVVYLMIIGTGVMMILSIDSFSNLSAGLKGEYISKVVLGVVIIGLMEMTLGKMSKGKSAKGLLIGMAVVFVLTVTLGLRLPIGF
ncbi:YisL family protein [Bacillus sp. AGMB 02131]|uniref:UPF0344 protein IEO70_18385 n=1 Tax=Peribacillus faecalis TaxID=2772559 RepID=A0A927CZ00_9BACI|nr:YisL family protein [Peribacillus faecalis]MBD3110298.1 YisL family protein [Peribacillus faecalis]